MVTFDRERWLERARRRYEKALSVGKSCARKAYNADKRFIGHLHEVVLWAHRHRLTESFVRNIGNSGGGRWLVNEGVIEISSRSLPEYQFYTFLHEAGHYLLHGAGAPRRSYIERYGKGYATTSDCGGSERKLDHRLAVLDEEFEAWHRGRKLAKRLKLRINEKNYAAFRRRKLRTYVDWTLSPGKYHWDP